MHPIDVAKLSSVCGGIQKQGICRWIHQKLVPMQDEPPTIDKLPAGTTSWPCAQGTGEAGATASLSPDGKSYLTYGSMTDGVNFVMGKPPARMRRP